MDSPVMLVTSTTCSISIFTISDLGDSYTFFVSIFISIKCVFDRHIQTGYHYCLFTTNILERGLYRLIWTYIRRRPKRTPDTPATGFKAFGNLY